MKQEIILKLIHVLEFLKMFNKYNLFIYLTTTTTTTITPITTINNNNNTIYYYYYFAFGIYFFILFFHNQYHIFFINIYIYMKHVLYKLKVSF